ncbi:MAG: glycosyl transferase family 90 [Alphaproteobacteria bacterium]|nr:glycosyl transferase family 90 [Alphaproteobacteria bacterium]
MRHLKKLIFALPLFFLYFMMAHQNKINPFEGPRSQQAQQILDDLYTQIKSQKHSYTKGTLDKFEAIVNDLVTKNSVPTDCFTRIDFTSGSFSAPALNNAYKDRLNILLDFLNTNVSAHLNKEKSFSFYSALGDCGALPKNLLAQMDIATVPILMIDIDKKYYKKDLKSIFLVPDFYLIRSKYSKSIDRIKKETKKNPFPSRKDIAIWRGSQTGGSYDMTEKDTIPRYRLVDFSLKNPDYVDARFVSHTCQVPDSDSGRAYTKFMEETFGTNPAKNFIRFENQATYKYIVSLDGNVSAWERVCFGMHMGTILLYQTNFVQFFTPYIKDGVHYIGINPDMSDIRQKIDSLRNDPEKCKTVMQNAQKFASDVLTPEFFVVYYANVLKAISDSFE